MKTLRVMLPCYNEEKDLAKLLTSWLLEREDLAKEGYGLKVTVIDDASKDRTPEIARDFMAREGEVIDLISHEKNLNLGGGVNTAIEAFNRDQKPGDLLCIMDGDNTQDPKYIHSMVEKIEEGYDVCIASRYCKGSKVEGVPSHRLFLSDGAKVYYQLVLGIPGVKDYTCGYRVYTYEIIKKCREVYGPRPIKNTSFACMMEVLYLLSKLGGRIGEVPFTLRYDHKEGTSKMNVFKTMKDSLLTALKIRFRSSKKKS